jgi:predicted ATPase
LLPVGNIVDVLSELVMKSLATADPSLTGIARYSMLETLRAYAGQRVRASGEAEIVGRRHLEHFLELAENAHRLRESTGLGAELETILAHQDGRRTLTGC